MVSVHFAIIQFHAAKVSLSRLQKPICLWKASRTGHDILIQPHPGAAPPTDNLFFLPPSPNMQKITLSQEVVNRGLNSFVGDSRSDNQIKKDNTVRLAMSRTVPPRKGTRFISGLSSAVLTRLAGRPRVAAEVIINLCGCWAARGHAGLKTTSSWTRNKKKQQLGEREAIHGTEPAVTYLHVLSQRQPNIKAETEQRQQRGPQPPPLFMQANIKAPGSL